MQQRAYRIITLLLLAPIVLAVLTALSACSRRQEPQARAPALAALTATVTPAGPATETATPAPTSAAPATPTPVHTAAPTATDTPTITPTPTPTATPIGPCTQRQPADDNLLALVSREYGLSRDYKPDDLVPLSDYFPSAVTLGYPTEVRQIIIDPLSQLVDAMHAEELSPLIVSGFRDYAAQALAREKWVEQYPEWAHNLSAPPGHSEHQLGTTVDFSSPDLPEMVGEEFIQFHPAFARTDEGTWLAAHAHEFGFTMSYPADRMEETAFWYEPWHFRYVGVDLATRLWEQDLTLSEYLLDVSGPPCIPADGGS
ncbi:MAG: M15 family metallopeptidase [Candidatus Promineifilaceae bacterium]|nr:M15 family metallopeptidase [Candidatus Promineifilaceae bacterium]